MDAYYYHDNGWFWRFDPENNVGSILCWYHSDCWDILDGIVYFTGEWSIDVAKKRETNISIRWKSRLVLTFISLLGVIIHMRLIELEAYLWYCSRGYLLRFPYFSLILPRLPTNIMQNMRMDFGWTLRQACSRDFLKQGQLGNESIPVNLLHIMYTYLT